MKETFITFALIIGAASAVVVFLTVIIDLRFVVLLGDPSIKVSLIVYLVQGQLYCLLMPIAVSRFRPNGGHLGGVQNTSKPAVRLKAALRLKRSRNRTVSFRVITGESRRSISAR